MPRKQIMLRRAVVDRLKKKPYKHDELRKALNIDNRMTLKRILDELKAYGILEKNNEGEWYFVGLEPESEFEKKCKLVHSQKLCRGLERLRNTLLVMNPRKAEDDSLVEAVSEHIESGYSKISNTLKEYRKIVSEESGIAYLNFHEAFRNAKLLTPENFWLMEFIETGKKQFLGRFFPEKQLKKQDVPYAYSFKDQKEVLQALEKANVDPQTVKMITNDMGDCWVLGPIPIEGDLEKVNELLRLYSELCRGISFLEDQINLGEQPLKGSCRLCNIT
jgi:hypothetical protein